PRTRPARRSPTTTGRPGDGAAARPTAPRARRGRPRPPRRGRPRARPRRGRGVDVPAALDEAVAELGTAVSELRQLAHGIRPSCLDDGLVPALSQLVSTTHLPIVLRVAATDLDQDVETTAYYVAAEAITNAVKHAEATTITLDVDVVDGHLRVCITDDGNGRASARPGSGLAGLVDRVGAHGGQLSINSQQGAGTIIEALL